jgi:aspartate-semialdehyde dehydrogenase
VSTTTGNYRVGLEGASTLLGKEILAALKTRSFPVSYVVGLEGSGEEVEPPILNIGDDPIPVIQESANERAECNIIFRAGRRFPGAAKPDGSGLEETPAGGEVQRRRFVIDASTGGILPSNAVLSMPLFDHATERVATAFRNGAQCFLCPHAATLALAGLVLRLAVSLDLRNISAVILMPASEFGPDGIDELQKQTIGLLSLRDVPRKVFGAQAAFNVSARLGSKAMSSLAATEARVRAELERLLDRAATVPAVRLVQAPSFYSMAFSVYAQSGQPATATQIEQALSGDGVQWIRSSQPSASPVDAQGSATLLLDPVTTEANPPGGFWLWGRVDDLRLQAENAVAIAELLRPFIDEP